MDQLDSKSILETLKAISAADVTTIIGGLLPMAHISSFLENWASFPWARTVRKGWDAGMEQPTLVPGLVQWDEATGWDCRCDKPRVRKHHVEDAVGSVPCWLPLGKAPGRWGKSHLLSGLVSPQPTSLWRVLPSFPGAGPDEVQEIPCRHLSSQSQHTLPATSNRGRQLKQRDSLKRDQLHPQPLH